MTPTFVYQTIIQPTLAYLPPRMESRAAAAMLLAIGLQESRFQHRRQIGGPARGFWQFERNGCLGVLRHSGVRDYASATLIQQCYEVTPEAAHAAVEHNDHVACTFARLLLWTLPDPLPGPDDAEEGWRQYLEAWRPGRPHEHTWRGFYHEAWTIV